MHPPLRPTVWNCSIHCLPVDCVEFLSYALLAFRLIFRPEWVSVFVSGFFFIHCAPVYIVRLHITHCAPVLFN